MTGEPLSAYCAHSNYVFEMLAHIGIKRLGRVPLSFIVWIGPRIAGLNAEAVRYALKEALADDGDKSMTLATFYQPALRYCEARGLSLNSTRFSLEWWQPAHDELIQ